MKELTKKEAARRVNDLGVILDLCHERAGAILQARFDEDFQTGWMGEGSIKQLDHYVRRLELMLKNLSRSHARTRLARELFIAVIRGDISIQEVAEEGSEANAQRKNLEANG